MWHSGGRSTFQRAGLREAMVKLEGNSSMIKEYTVIDGRAKDKINDLIFKGWQPYGGITGAGYQVMVKMERTK